MPISTSKQLANYFREFSEIEVTFTKEVTHAVRLNATGVQLKCLGEQWPCVVYSSSMTSARIITNLNPSLNETLKKAKNGVSLRFSFLVVDKPEPLSFFVKAKAGSFVPYGDSGRDLYFADLSFNQKPPDDLILVLGRLLETRQNASRRSEWRVPVTPVIVKTLGIRPDLTTVTSGDLSWRAILRDVSFSGCKMVVAAELDSVGNRDIVVRMVFEDPDEEFEIPAIVQRTDSVEGHDEIGVFGVRFRDDTVPMSYKLRINTVASSRREEIGQ